MILNVVGLSFSFPGRPVLENTSLTVQRGEILAVLGPNGTGKTTLLKCINRILQPQAGAVYVENLPAAEFSPRELAHRFGYVEQHRNGSSDTVFNAVMLGRRPYMRWDVTSEDMAIVERALDTLGLTDFALRRLDELSGGELQKVVIARALAQQPKVLLMDEPTSCLDLKNQLEVLNLIRKIAGEQGIGVVVAIHDINLALRYADRFILLRKGAVFAAGGGEVINPESIQAVYEVPVKLHSCNGSRVVIPA